VLQSFFEASSSTALGTALRNSLYWFPLVETTHLLALAFLLGSLLIFNMRFFGRGMRRQTPAEIQQDFAPWTRRALIVMAISGVLLFLAKAQDLYDMDLRGFLIKMTLIVAATIFHYAVQRPLARAGNMLWGRMTAALALCMWFGAAVAGLTLEFL
jgi:hypothetical protein